MSKLGGYANLHKFKQLGGYANLHTWNSSVNPQKIKCAVGWLCQSIENKVAKKKKEYPIYVLKLSEWGKSPQGQAEKRIHYVIKLRQNITQVLHCPYLSFTYPKICSQFSQFYHSVFFVEH